MTALLSKEENDTPIHDITDYLACFHRLGRKTDIYEKSGLTYYVNDYWTSSQRQSNRLHEVSYRACFKAELPSFFINALTQEGDVVYDPFMGRGTTPLQAALMNRRPMGNDVNPLSVMMVRPRLNPPLVQDIAQRLADIAWKNTQNRNGQWDIDDTLLAFYHPKTLQDIYCLKHWLLERVHLDDPIDAWIRMVALHCLTGHSKGFFSGYTLPPNQAMTAERQKRMNTLKKQTPPPKDIKAIILKKSASLLSQSPQLPCLDAILSTQPADKTPHIRHHCVDLVVTSPPFLDIVNYAQDNWLRCWFADINVDSVPFSMCKKVDDWTQFTRSVLGELVRVVKPGGYIAYEVGDVRSGKILLEHSVAKATWGLPLDIEAVMVNQQHFTKTAHCWGVTNNAKGTNSNRIIVMKRH